MSATHFAEIIASKLLSIRSGLVSRHLDELISAPLGVPNYGDWCLLVFLELAKYLRGKGEERTIVWVVPMAVSEQLRCYHVSVSDVVYEISPATVYLLETTDVFAKADEEYRRDLRLFPNSRSLNGIFRSWRDPDAANQGWEFSNDIYLVSHFMKQNAE